MKILIIYPNRVTIARVPLGLGYLSSYLKRSNHELKLFDTTFFKCSDTDSDDILRERTLQINNPDLNYNIMDIDILENLKQVVEEFNPDIIGMTIVDPNYKFGLDILRFCKKTWSTIPTIVGGPLTTFIPEIIIKEDCIDALARGECELALEEFCNKYQTGGWENTFNVKNFWIKDKNNIIHKNETVLFDIKNCLDPDLDIYDRKHFIRPLGGKIYNMATVIWTRGCLFNCSYCANRSFFETINVSAKEYYRIAEVEQFINFLEKIKNKYNLEFIMFVDDIWPMHNPTLVKKFCDLYKEKVNLPFSINVHCKIVREDSFKMAVDAGLRNICVGVESGSKTIRKEILNRIYTDNDLQKVFNLAHKYKIRSSSFNILGLPTETKKDIFSTINLNKKLRPNSATVTIFHPYRGSILRQMCINKNYIKDSDDKFEDVYRSDSHLNMPQISKEELKTLMDNFQLYFKLPKICYPIIYLASSNNKISKYIRNKIVLPLFKMFNRQESNWNFNNKQWWNNHVVSK